MRLRNLISGLDSLQVLNFTDRNVTSVTCDSRQVTPGSAFIALKGATEDGHKYIADALARGANTIVVQDAANVPGEVCLIIAPNSRHALAVMADNFYDHPSRRIKVIGVTGTNGKTTTTYLLRSILEVAGKKTGLLGTINYEIGGRIIPAPNTTPGALDLQKYLADIAAEGAEYAVMEVSATRSSSTAWTRWTSRARYSRTSRRSISTITRRSTRISWPRPSFSGTCRAGAQPSSTPTTPTRGRWRSGPRLRTSGTARQSCGVFGGARIDGPRRGDHEAPYARQARPKYRRRSSAFTTSTISSSAAAATVSMGVGLKETVGRHRGARGRAGAAAADNGGQGLHGVRRLRSHGRRPQEGARGAQAACRRQADRRLRLRRQPRPLEASAHGPRRAGARPTSWS